MTIIINNIITNSESIIKLEGLLQSRFEPDKVTLIMEKNNQIP